MNQLALLEAVGGCLKEAARINFLDVELGGKRHAAYQR